MPALSRRDSATYEGIVQVLRLDDVGDDVPSQPSHRMTMYSPIVRVACP